MKSNVISAAIVLTMCLCAWGYLAAQSDKATGIIPSFNDPVVVTTFPPPQPISPLLEIREPSQEDFEHCAKRAVDFMASWSDNQAQTDIALHELLENRALSTQDMGVSRFLTQIKADTTYSHPKLIAKKSCGEDIIMLYYMYHTDKGAIFCHFSFTRNLDKNGEPQQWRCVSYNFSDAPERIMLF